MEASRNDYSYLPLADYAVDQARIVLDLELNQTPAYIPTLFLQCKPVSVYRCSVNELFDGSAATRTPALDLAKGLKHDIDNHIEMRIQLMAEQLLLTYGTNLQFRKYRTELQAGMSNKQNSCELVEAHCGTLPSLSFVAQAEYEAHFLLDGDVELEPRVFAALSSSHSIWSTTTKLPKFVNDLDSAIDEGTRAPFLGSDHFRNYCIAVLNFNSAAKLDPVRGLQRFLKTLDQLLAYLAQTKDYPSEKSYALRRYQKIVRIYLDEKMQERLISHLISGVPDVTARLAQNYQTIQLWFATKTEADSRLWQRFQAIEARASILIGEEFNYKRLLLRCLLLEKSRRSDSRAFYEQTIITLNLHPTKRAKEFWRSCMASSEIVATCSSYFASRTYEDRLKISNLIRERIQTEFSVQRPQNLNWVEYEVMRCCAPSTEPKFRAVEQFLGLSHSWAQPYLRMRSLGEYIDRCLGNVQFVAQVDAFIDDVELHVRTD